ncbi:hypothetical protein [Pseudarthrobacter albicanus]|uniref:hypothetical protein n=1 Tax=Pseudarthrobacter albicanus TaxID=2823873 RepID=UPI001FE3893B|nr:hypothetical protein [Pseudarthrobacter albicanus]
MTEEPKGPAATEGPGPPASGTERRRPDRTLPAVLAAIAVLVIVALAVVFTRGDPEPLDAATPAGVVQRYAAAVIDGDETAASAYLTAAARNKCGAGQRSGADRLRVTLVDTTERADSADVKVLITVFEGGGPFGSSEYQVRDVFDLARTGDKWLIDNAPWQLTVCTNPAVKR